MYENVTSSAIISEFFLVTNIRVMLEAFIMPSGITTETVSESTKRSLYFSVQDWNVLVACYCYGQASKCESDVSICNFCFVCGCLIKVIATYQYWSIIGPLCLLVIDIQGTSRLIDNLLSCHQDIYNSYGKDGISADWVPFKTIIVNKRSR